MMIIFSSFASCVPLC